MAEVPFFVKQWGEWHPSAMHDPATCSYQSTTANHEVLGHQSLALHVWNLVAKALAGMGYGK